MPIGTPQGNLDIKNATLRTSNLETQNIKIGSIFVGTGNSLEETANVGNTTSNTIQFTNTHTAFTTTGNVSVGGELTVTGNVAVDTDTLFVDTVNDRVGLGTDSPLSSTKLETRGNVLFDLSKGDTIPTGLYNYMSTQLLIDTEVYLSRGTTTASTDIEPPPGVAGDVICKFVNSYSGEAVAQSIPINMPVTTGDTIYFGGWYYAPSTNIVVQHFAGAGGGPSVNYNVTGDATWRWIERTVTATSTATIGYRIDNDTAGGTIYITGLTVRKNPSQTTNLPFTPRYSPHDGIGSVFTTQNIVAKEAAIRTLTGNVGIGTDSPEGGLHVYGKTFILGQIASAPSGPDGTMYYNSTTNQPLVKVNGSWISLVNFSPSNIIGLVGWYLPENWTGSQWTDASAVGNDVTASEGTINYNASHSGSSVGANGTFPVLYGDTTAELNFPTAILPPTYTLISMTRYNGSNKYRILDGQTGNWLSGHWDGASGVAYHGGWLTVQTDRHGSNWVIGVDQNSLYRSKSQSVAWTNDTGGGGTSTNLRLGAVDYEPSDWMCAELIVYNRTLSSDEYTQLSDYMQNKYGIY